MSQYATVAELKQLGLPAEALEELLDADIDAHLQACAGYMDAMIGGRYTLPISAPYPDVMKLCNVGLAVYHILLRRGFNPEGYDDQYKLMHDRWERWLEDVRDGKQSIPGIADATPTTREGVPQVYTSTLRGW